MWKKFCLLSVGVLAIGFPSAPRAQAGTEMVEPDRAPAPRYNYAPPPPPAQVYCAPPPVSVVVYPAVYPVYGYYGPRFGGFGYLRFSGRGGYGHRHHWR